MTNLDSIFNKGPHSQSYGFSSSWASLGDSDHKESAYNVGGLSLITGLGRSPGGGHDNPLQYSCLENPMDRGAWQAAVPGIAKSRTGLSG